MVDIRLEDLSPPIVRVARHGYRFLGGVEVWDGLNSIVFWSIVVLRCSALLIVVECCGIYVSIRLMKEKDINPPVRV